MNWHRTLPKVIVVALAGIVSFLAWSGVKTSIADAIFILGVGFCFTHLLCFAYTLGRRHEMEQAERQVVESKKVIKRHTIDAETKEEKDVVGVQEHSPRWNPADDFS